MSWRVVFEPCKGAAPEFGDWRIPLEATDEVVKEIAKQAAWQQPLKLFVEAYDHRLLVFVSSLAFEYSMQYDKDYAIYLDVPEAVCPSTNSAA